MTQNITPIPGSELFLILQYVVKSFSARQWGKDKMNTVWRWRGTQQF